MHSLCLLTVLTHFLASTVKASSFATFNDSTCSGTNVVQNIAAVDGYPAGGCTSLDSSTTDKGAPSAAYSSFQFLTLDSGCAITVYQPDTNELSCSGQAVLGAINICYNTSWAYYSVDNCDIPSLLSDALATATSTSASSGTSSAASTTPTQSTTGVGLTSGGVAGIVIGCIAGTAAVLATIWFVMGRRRAAKQSAPVPEGQENKETLAKEAPEVYVPQAWHASRMHSNEVDGQGFVEVPYDTHYPVVNASAELSGRSGPGELATHQY